MQDKPVIYLVAVKCEPEFEEKFNTWYEGEHIPHLAKSKFLDEYF